MASLWAPFPFNDLGYGGFDSISEYEYYIRFEGLPKQSTGRQSRSYFSLFSLQKIESVQFVHSEAIDKRISWIISQ